MSINERISYYKRYKFILKVLISYGFDNIVKALDLTSYLNYWYAFVDKKRELPLNKEISNEKKLRMALEKLGPTFIKLGQLLSSRPDVIPKSYIEEFKKLQNDVNEEDYLNIKKTIQSSLRQKIDKVFEYIIVKPIGTASIAQVHEAKLKTGESVVIKVKKANVEELIKLDLQILSNFADFVQKNVPSLAIYKPKEIIEEFFITLTNELDFNLEARNNDIFASQFRGFQGFIVPKIYWEYTNEDIIVMEKIEGKRLAEIMYLKSPENKKIASLLARIFLKQVLETGYFHGDPHPGNIIVSGENLAFIDYGSVGKIDEFTQEQMLDMFYSLISRNSERIISFFKRHSVIPKGTNIRKLRLDIENLIDKYCDVPINQIDSNALLNKVYDLVAYYKLNIRTDFFLITKSIILIDGIIRVLNPEINVLSESNEFIGKLIKKKYSVERFSRSALELLESYKNLAQRIPFIIENLAHQAEEKEEKDTTRESEFRNLSLAFIAFGIAIAASQFLKYEVLPYFYGYSLPGVGLLGLALITIFKVFNNLA